MIQKKTPEKQSAKPKEKPDIDFAFERSNYIWLGIGLFFIALGFMLMSGGGSDNPALFDESIFNFRRTVLAPALVLAGYGIEVYAIMKKPGKDNA